MGLQAFLFWVLKMGYYEISVHVSKVIGLVLSGLLFPWRDVVHPATDARSILLYTQLKKIIFS